MTSGLNVQLNNEKAFSAAVQNLDRGLRTLDKALNKTGKNLDDLDKKLDQSRRGTLSKLQTSLTNLTKKLDKFGDTARRSNDFTRLNRGLEKLTDKLEKLGRALSTIDRDLAQGFKLSRLEQTFNSEGDRIARAFIDSIKKQLGIASPSRVMVGIGQSIEAGFRGGLRAANFARLGAGAARDFVQGFRRGLDGLRRATDSALQNIRTFSRNAALVLTTAFLAVTGGGLSQAVGFESAFAGVIKTVDATVEEFAVIESGIRDLATNLDAPTSGIDNAAISLANLAEQAGQLGIAKDAILPFVETIGQLQLTTNLGEQGATELARFLNITGGDVGSQIGDIGNVIVDLGNNLATTEAEIVEFAQRLAGAGTQAGLSEAEILALGGALSSVGLNAEAGGTALTQVITTITKAVTDGSTDLNTFAGLAGESADQFADSWGDNAAGALQEFAIGLSTLSSGQQIKVLESLGLDGIRTADALRRMAGNTELFADAYQTANEALGGTALLDEANKRFDTTGAKLAALNNIFKETRLIIGEALLPAFNDLIRLASEGLTAFNNLDPTIQRFAAVLLVATTAGAGLVAAAMFPLTLAAQGLLAVLFNPVGIIAGLGAMAAGFALVLPAALALGAGLFGLVSVVSDIQNNVGGAGDAFEELKTAIGGLLEAIGAFISSGLQAVGVLADDFDRGANSARSAESAVTGFINTLTEGVNRASTKLNELATLFEVIALASGAEVRTPNAGADNSLLQERKRLLDEINQGGAGGQVAIQAGDTLSGIASRYGVSVDDLLAANQGNDAVTNRNLIRAGGSLTIPGLGGAGGAEEARARIDQIDKALQRTEESGNSLEATFNRFADTGLFKSMFGDSPADRVRALAFIYSVQEAIQSIGEKAGMIQEGIGLLFSDDSAAAVSLIKQGVGGLVVELANLAGVNLDESIAALLSEGDIGGALRQGILSAGDGIGNAVGFVVENGIKYGFLRIPRILSALGIDTFDPFLSLLDQVAALAGETVSSGISNSFAALRGDISPADAVGNILSDIQAEIDANPALSDLQGVIQDILDAFDSLDGEGTATAIEGLIGKFGDLGDDLSGAFSEEDVANLEKIGGFIAGLASVPIAAQMSLLNNSLVAFGEGLDTIRPALDILLGLTGIIVGIAELDGAKVASNFNRIKEAAEDLLLELAGVAGALVGVDVEAGLESFNALPDQLETILEGVRLILKVKLNEAALEVAEGVNKIIENLNKIADAPTSLLDSLGLGIGDFEAIGEIDTGALQERIADAQAELDAFSNPEDGGGNMILGLFDVPTEGLQEKASETMDAYIEGLRGFANAAVLGEENPGVQLGNQLKEGVNTALEIQSPSGVGLRQGAMYSQGVAMGVIQNIPVVIAATTVIRAAFVSVVQGIIASVNSLRVAFGDLTKAVLGVTQTAPLLVSWAAGVQSVVGTVTTATSQMAAGFNGLADAISSAISKFNQAKMAGLQSIPGFADGGVAPAGAFMAGERGRELIFAGSEMSVLNNRTTEAFMSGLSFGRSSAPIAQRPAPMAGSGGSVIYTDNRTVAVNVSQSNASPQDIESAAINAMRRYDRENPMRERLVRSGAV